jgi:hypothetical protein
VPGRASGPSRSLDQQRRRIAMCSEKLIGYLGFFRRGVFIGEEAMSGVAPGLLTPWRRGPARCEPGLWPLSYSSSDLWKLLGKIRLQELVSSNSENISYPRVTISVVSTVDKQTWHTWSWSCRWD